MSHLVLLHPVDDVAIATQSIPAGTEVQAGDHCITTRQTIPAGHKVALRSKTRGESILRYGSNIGRATQDISVGDHVHSHNLHHEHVPQERAQRVNPPAPPALITGRTFQGYQRPDGRVGTRNYVAVVSTVNCSASVAHVVTERMEAEIRERFPHVDGIMPVAHEGGCGMPYGGLKHQMLARVLVGLSRHPNVAGCVLVGLGCEQGTMGYLAQDHGLVPLKAPDGSLLGKTNTLAPIPMLSIQDEGGIVARSKKRSGPCVSCFKRPSVRDVSRVMPVI